jgi:actin-related protein 6
MATTKVIVIDNGAHTCKVGFGGQAKPIKLISHCAVQKIATTTTPNNTTAPSSASSPTAKNAATNPLTPLNSLLMSQSQQQQQQQQQSQNQWLIADQLDSIMDFTNVNVDRPHQYGYVCNWELENSIWSRIFSPSILDIRPESCTLLLTDPLFTPPTLRHELDQTVFEYYNFFSYHRTVPSSLALRGFQYEVQSLYGKPCACIIDIGYSFTYVVPLYNYVPIYSAVKRMNIGGKVLTNYCKELITQRYMDVSDQFVAINDIKERMCLFSLDFSADMQRMSKEKEAKKRMFLSQEYVMPDRRTSNIGVVRECKPEALDIENTTEKNTSSPPKTTADTTTNTNTTTSKQSKDANGTAAMDIDTTIPSPPSTTNSSATPSPNSRRKDENVLRLATERIAVPEILFYPSDAGMTQQGLAETVVSAIQSCDASLHALLYSHIICVGGSAQLTNLVPRLTSELMSLVPAEYAHLLCVRLSKEPLLTAWCGGSCLSIDPNFGTVCVTKKEYEEYGEQILMRKFV